MSATATLFVSTNPCPSLRFSSSIKPEIFTKHLLAVLILLLSHAENSHTVFPALSTLQVIKFSLLYCKELVTYHIASFTK